MTFFLFVEILVSSSNADGHTLYNFGNDLEDVKITPQSQFKSVTKWFYESYIVLDSRKSRYFALEKQKMECSFIVILSSKTAKRGKL